METESGRVVVCVTGGGGYLASWLIKRLLSLNYLVHATLRDPSDENKAQHLRKLENSHNLKLFKADLLDYASLSSAIRGCSGVFHTASPVPPASVPNPQVEVVEPAVNGTLNVLRASLEAKVDRVVVVSSVASVLMNPTWPVHLPMDETSWSDPDYCTATQNWYCYSKTKAESEAVKFATENGLRLVCVCPSLILGPLLQPTVNSSSLVLIKLLKEGYESLEDKVRMIVDVRDVAEALVLAYEKPDAEGRYICSAHKIRSRDLVEKLKSIYPEYNYPKKFIESADGAYVSSEKLQSLGWSYRSLEETLIDSVESYRNLGILD